MYDTFQPEQPVGLMDFVRPPSPASLNFASELKTKLDARKTFASPMYASPPNSNMPYDGSHLVPRASSKLPPTQATQSLPTAIRRP